MHADFIISASTLYSFALVLSRMAGVFVFLPLPGLSAAPAAARVVLSLVSTLAMASRWPELPNVPVGAGQFAGWLLLETGFGLCIGMAVAFLMESFYVAIQVISVQAGFSYASTVDPSTNADSTVLLMVAQLFAALLFFSSGLDHQVLTILANSLQSQPPGTFELTRPHVEALLSLGTNVFSTGIRLVLPLATLLFLVDLCMGLLGRLNAQLQVMSLALPFKMLLSLAIFSWSVLLFPKVFNQLSSAIFGVLRQVLGV
ncbi:MAG TPA: flagellar biosynthetic protein FliR [Bryobacteraceae bacterium]|nr:flagellar biosynthetic protein FliR [Bryobacteraceae bacterium]